MGIEDTANSSQQSKPEGSRMSHPSRRNHRAQPTSLSSPYHHLESGTPHVRSAYRKLSQLCTLWWPPCVGPVFNRSRLSVPNRLQTGSTCFEIVSTWFWLGVLSFALPGTTPATLLAQPTDRKSDTQALWLVDDAADYYITGEYSEAIKLYEKLLDEPRVRLEAGLGLAQCQMQVGQYDQALSGLLELDAPQNVPWHTLLGKLSRRLGNYPKALEHARTAIGLDDRYAPARLLLADMLMYLGRRREAIQAYRWFDDQVAQQTSLPRDAEWITSTAQGFLKYSTLTRTNLPTRTKHVLNKMLQVAYERVDRSYWPGRIVAGNLLREKFNNGEYDGSLADYEAALRLNKNLPQAFVGMGEVALSSWQFEMVEKYAEKALKINPHYAEAIHLLGKKFILERRYDQAMETADRALVINPNDLMAHSIRAAASACLFDDEQVKKIVEQVRKINPQYPFFHRLMGDALGGIRQYAASEQAYQQAITFDPTDANARTELGMMYMQWGDEEKARLALEGAWSLDPFNERTKFTLELLDQLERFATVETEHFIVKYNPETDPGLGEFIIDYLEEIHEIVTGDFDTTLEHKTIIEMFPTHRAFGVRITGKPWIHTVGAATGRVIALAAPRETNRFGTYNIARVLKHEYTHTVTLAATANRIPHWFTEGLAVAQEEAPRPFGWWLLLADAVRRDQLFTLESIDWGFMRPKRPNDRQIAYAQSEWMCEFLVEQHGYEIINRILQLYKVGQRQGEIFRTLLGTTTQAFDESFKIWAHAQIGKSGFDLSPIEEVEMLIKLADSNPGDGAIFGRLAKAVLDAGDAKRALQLAQRALEFDEENIHGLSTMVAASFALSRKERSESAKLKFAENAKPILERLLVRNPDHWIALKYAAEIALGENQHAQVIDYYQRLQKVCPMDPASWRGLAGIYLQHEDDELALPQLLELTRLEENDADIPIQIASMAQKRGRQKEAQYWYKMALYADPYRTKIHQALGDISMQMNDLPAALSAYRLLTKLQPQEVKHFERASVAAFKLNRKEEAQALALQAVKLNPNSSARSILP